MFVYDYLNESSQDSVSDDGVMDWEKNGGFLLYLLLMAYVIYAYDVSFFCSLYVS